MKILFVTSECAPFSKSGGLADVAFSLPPALKAAGNEIAIITPLYQCVKEKFGKDLKTVWTGTVKLGWREHYCGLVRGDLNGVTVWFVDNEDFFLRPRLYGYDDDKLRFAWFSRAVIDLFDKLDFVPEILHCNDWETAPAVIYLKNEQTWRLRVRRPPRHQPDERRHADSRRRLDRLPHLRQGASFPAIRYGPARRRGYGREQAFRYFERNRHGSL